MPTEGGGGPKCPGCGQALEGNLRVERLDAQDVSKGVDSVTRVSVIYCGSCGVSLHIQALPQMQAVGAVPVGDPDDPTALEGHFHIRCQQLVEDIRALGFDPFVWVDLINDLGAVVAAKRVLGSAPLVATRWLIGIGRQDLTLEHEVLEHRWADLFDNHERSIAKRRLGIP